MLVKNKTTGVIARVPGDAANRSSAMDQMQNEI